MKNTEFNTAKPDSEKSPERLEAEVNATRARIDDRLEILSHRLSPGDMLDQVLGVVRDHGGDFSRNLCNQMKNNPVPTILTGVGLTWLMIGSSTRSNRYAAENRQYRGLYDGLDDEVGYADGVSGYEDLAGREYEPGVMDKAKDALHNLGDEAEQLKQSARDGIHRASEAAHERMHRASESAHQRMHRASEAAQRGMRSARYNAHVARDSMSSFLHEQPVLAASLGVAIGAALGALLPTTDVEERVLGNAGEKAIDKAQAVASSQYGKVKATVQEVAEHARQVLQEDSDNASGQSGQQSNQANPQAGASTTRTNQVG